jgi:hypothetical protein
MADRRGPPRIRAAAPLLAALLGLGVVACSPTPSAEPSEVPSVAPATQPATVVPSALPTESAASTATATPAATGISAAPPCAAADLKASHDLVEGAAGSRLTTVVLVAASTCSVDLFPAMGIRGGDGTQLVGSTSTGSGRIDLHPDVSYSSAVRFANWCGLEPESSLSLVIRVGPDEVPVTGGSYPEPGDMPPCNGGGGPVLEAGQWEAAP